MKYSPHHTAISVRNLQNSVDFYKNFGFQVVHEYAEADGSMKITHIKLGDFFIELFWYSRNSEGSELVLEYANDLEKIGVKHFAMEVENVESALEDLRAKGLADQNTKITVGKTKVSYFFVKDPDGVWVEVLRDDRYNSRSEN